MKHLILSLLIFWVAPAQAQIAIQEVTSPGGINAWLVEEHSIPFTALEISFKGGAALEAEGKRGAIAMMTWLLEDSGGALDSKAFAEARERLATSFSFDVDDDTISVSAKFLTENRDEAVDLLKMALISPRFDQEDFDRLHGQLLSFLRSRETDPEVLSEATFDALAFPNHPYGVYYGGTLESAPNLTRADILEAYTRAIARDRLYVAAVGDITAEELGQLLDNLLGALPETGAPQPERVEYALGPGVTVVDFDSPQSVVQFGQPGIAFEDPDYLVAYVLNTILGGSGLSTRLMDELREKRGLTYGVRTHLIPLFVGEEIIGYFSSSNDKVAEAIELVREEWAKIAGQGVTAEELADAKTYLTGAYPLRFDGNGPIARIMVNMQMDNQPIEYIAERNDLINAITLDEINRVAARIYQPDALHFVVVGRPEGLESTP